MYQTSYYDFFSVSKDVSVPVSVKSIENKLNDIM